MPPSYVARRVPAAYPTAPPRTGSSSRLDLLEREGIVTKTVESTMPPRTRYELTDGGVALQDVIDAIGRWAREHLQRCRGSGTSEQPGTSRSPVATP